jgi:Na+-transporting NADH:ubiquinone oxidoreductase subunit NqrF
VKLAEVLVEEMVAVLAACGGGRKKKKQKTKICRGEREDLTVAALITGEDLGSWGG